MSDTEVNAVSAEATDDYILYNTEEHIALDKNAMFTQNSVSPDIGDTIENNSNSLLYQVVDVNNDLISSEICGS